MSLKNTDWSVLKKAREPTHYFDKYKLKKKELSVHPSFLYKLFRRKI